MSTQDIMIHVRFAPDGTVTEIGERPSGCTAQQWFNFLTQQHGLSYLTLSGGRISGHGGAARLLAMNPSTLRGKMRKYGIRTKKTVLAPGD